VRKISAAGDRLAAEGVGEVEEEEGVLVIRRIHVRLNLKAPAADRETAERVHGVFHDRCPVYRTLKPAIAITTELVFQPLEG
jgi:organic hydroperoxide reductase OsmC/OhrA